MSLNLSQGTLHVNELTIEEINRVLDTIRVELDQLAGLRGRVTIQDHLEVIGDVVVRGKLVSTP